MPAAPLIPCEFFLIRYVPDVVKGEFINIGVLLREASAKPGSTAACRVRFTRDWSRVRGISPDANTVMLEDLEAEILKRFDDEALQPVLTEYPKRILATLLDSSSNAVQISEPQACLAQTFKGKLDELMRLHVETLKEGRPTRDLTGRAAIVAKMRNAFEEAEVWKHMQKRIPASQYTRPGDPFKLDCGYSDFVPDAQREATGREDIIRIFHAVSLASDIESSRSLAFVAPQLREGATRVRKKTCLDEGRKWNGLEFDLAAVVEPIRSISPGYEEGTDAAGLSDEAAELYLFGVFTMQSAGIRVLTTNNLPAAAARARLDLQL